MFSNIDAINSSLVGCGLYVLLFVVCRIGDDDVLKVEVKLKRFLAVASKGVIGSLVTTDNDAIHGTIIHSQVHASHV